MRSLWRWGATAVLIAGCIQPGAALAAGPLDPHLPLTGRARIGVEVQVMTPELRGFLDAPSDRGILVVRVTPGGPGAEAGLAVGDVVTRVDGEPVERTRDLAWPVARAERDAELVLEVYRDGVALTLGVRPEGAPSPWASAERWERLLEKGLRRGEDRLRERLEELEERLDAWEEQLDEPAPGRPT